MNIAPDAEAKVQITQNALDALRRIGILRPRVAVLTANERVDPAMQATLDAAEICRRIIAEPSFSGVIEGPIAADVAFDPQMAAHKGIDSRVAGEADLLVFPNMEACNIFCKSLIHFANFKIAGAILGAAAPVVMVSRGDNAEAKLNSVALGCLLSK